MYQLTDVGKRFRKDGAEVVALRDVNLAIEEGDFLVVQGPTGHGKSTLLQLLGALDRPTSGTIVFESRDLSELSERQLTELRGRAFGFVFQTFNLIPTLTALENVEAALVPLRIDGAERRERALGALRNVGLEDRAGHLPLELSGGQQQRAAIARALVKSPRVILADEPTGNLDQDTRDEIVRLLRRLWERQGQTLVLVTHDNEIARSAPRSAWIYEGGLSTRERPPARRLTTSTVPGQQGQVSGAPATG